jgi:predicted methyltransferase
MSRAPQNKVGRCVGIIAMVAGVACARTAAKPAGKPTPAPASSSSSSSAPPSGGAPVAPDHGAADKKRDEDLRRLKEENAKIDAEHEQQLARLTPAIRGGARALSSKSYPSGHAAIRAVLAGQQRTPGNAERDKYRHPLETLDLFGLRPSWTVLEYEPGGGWYTELLAPALAKKGRLLVTSGDPKGPDDQRSTLFARRLKLLLETFPELFGKVETVVVDAKAPTLPLDSQLDLVLVIRELHNIVNAGQLQTWLAEFHKALKPGGVLGIVEHRALAGADPLASSKKGYLPEAWVIEQIEAAGFHLEAKSDINANPKDTKDYPEGVWTLPPTYRLGKQDHEKYAAIGESDRMTLRFVRR